MTLVWPNKDPDEVLDYVVDWADRLDGDTIAESTWIVPDGITKVSDGHDDSTVTIWLSGGTIGTAYSLVNRIVTAAARTMDQTVRLKIRAR